MNLMIMVSDHVVALNFGRKTRRQPRHPAPSRRHCRLSGNGQLIAASCRPESPRVYARRRSHGSRVPFNKGGITTILAANGAETTTLRAVCGMVRTQGEISFDARRIDGKRNYEMRAAASRTFPMARHFLQLTTGRT